MRGESENRNKEFKCGMAMERLSDHRFMANYFRLYLHAAALNLLVRLRREIADPPQVPAGYVPVAALQELQRKQYQNARRRQDPLGEGHPATWRLLLIKVAATVALADYLRNDFHLPGREPWPDSVRQIRFWDLDRYQEVRWAEGSASLTTARACARSRCPRISTRDKH